MHDANLRFLDPLWTCNELWKLIPQWSSQPTQTPVTVEDQDLTRSPQLAFRGPCCTKMFGKAVEKESQHWNREKCVPKSTVLENVFKFMIDTGRSRMDVPLKRKQ